MTAGASSRQPDGVRAPTPLDQASDAPPLVQYAQGQPLHVDRGLLIPAVYARRQQAQPLNDSPEYRDCYQAEALAGSDWASDHSRACSDEHDTLANMPPEPAQRHNKRLAFLQLESQRGDEGHYMDLSIKDPRGIFCLHSVPCCSGPFTDAGKCSASHCGRFCSCKLPMPLARQV